VGDLVTGDIRTYSLLVVSVKEYLFQVVVEFGRSETSGTRIGIKHETTEPGASRFGSETLFEGEFEREPSRKNLKLHDNEERMGRYSK
jgi:hypothetical protein